MQLDIFRSETQIDLQNQTPISLFVSAFKEAVNDSPESDLLDKSLLRDLKNFRKAFLNANESFVISNEGSFDSFELNKKALKK